MSKRNQAASVFNFTLILDGFESLTEGIEDAIYLGGCDDAVLGVRNRVPYLEFDRESDSLPDAVMSAIEDVHETDVARVIRVEPDDAVSASEIARRTGRTRQSIQQLALGTRGPGDFPSPVAGLRTHSPAWSWADVADWMNSTLPDAGITPDDVASARFLALLNHMLSWPSWGDVRTANRIWRCIRPGREDDPGCRSRTWLRGMRGA